MLVSVVVPCRNEREHVTQFLRCLLDQEVPTGIEFEILIADGSSSDGSREILEAYRKHYPQIGIIDNPRAIVSTGLNAAIQRARGEVIVRMDVHTFYARDYVAQCIQALSTSDASNVGGPTRTIARTSTQKAISIAYHSSFFTGGAKFHNPSYEGHVDTVPYGCWRRQTLLDVGLFDEDQVRSQDAELNFRIRQCGGKLWQSREIRSWYKPRSSFKELCRQYARYGYWKFRIIQKHHTIPSLRQIVPGLCLAIWLLFLLLSPFSSAAAWVVATFGAAYGFANLLASLAACHAEGCWRLLPVVSCVFATVHVSWGLGFLAGLVDFSLLRRLPSLRNWVLGLTEAWRIGNA